MLKQNKMKKIVIFGLLTLAFFNCKAQVVPLQQIIPVEQVIDTYDIVPDENAYIKDINDVFDSYIGTWSGTLNNKNYTFIISKTTIVFDEEYNILQDILIMKHIIVDANTSQVIEDTTNLPNNDAPCTGMIFRTTSQPGLTYVFSYIGIEVNKVACGQNGDVFITLTNNNTQMYLLLYPDHEVYSECQTGPAEQVLPTEKVLLTKQ